MLAVAITLPSVWFAEPIVVILFGYGQMGADEVRQIGELAQICFWTLPGVALSGMAMAMMNAKRQARTLLLLTGASAASLLVLAVPGVLLGDARLITAALPVAQGLLACLLLATVWLGRGRARLPVSRIYAALAGVILITALSVTTDIILALEHDVIRVVLAALSAGLSMVWVMVVLDPRKGGQIGKAHI